MPSQNQANLMLVQTGEPLLQKAINFMETVSMWERKAARKAHIVGLQGEKRRLRRLSREARNIVDWIEYTTYDVLCREINNQAGNTDVSTLKCPKSTMTGMVDKLWTIYNEVHQMANDLVVAKLRSFSAPLYCYAEGIFELLGELNRNFNEYEMAKWEYHHISRYQVSWYNIHDEEEDKEESQGYKDHK